MLQALTACHLFGHAFSFHNPLADFQHSLAHWLLLPHSGRMAAAQVDPAVRSRLAEGLVIPACPLALNSARKFDERRQRALLRYYMAAGAGGVAVAVHTTQFA